MIYRGRVVKLSKCEFLIEDSGLIFIVNPVTDQWIINAIQRLINEDKISNIWLSKNNKLLGIISDSYKFNKHPTNL